MVFDEHGFLHKDYYDEMDNKLTSKMTENEDDDLSSSSDSIGGVSPPKLFKKSVLKEENSKEKKVLCKYCNKSNKGST